MQRGRIVKNLTIATEFSGLQRVCTDFVAKPPERIPLAVQLFGVSMFTHWFNLLRFGKNPVNKSLQKLIEISSKVRMTPQQVEKQRISFAYGSAKIENDIITKEMVSSAAEKIKKDKK